MSTPSPFEVAIGIGNNFAQSFARVKDENAIESILAQAMATEDPKVIQNSIGKILSQVSPDRQEAAVKYLQNTMTNLQKKQQETQGRAAAAEAGYTYGTPPAVAAAQVREGAKGKRIAEANKQFEGQLGQQGQNNQPNKQQLLARIAHPDREISEPAKAQLKTLDNEIKEDRADIRERRKETLPLKQAIIERANLSRASIQNKEHLLNIIDRGNIDDPTLATFKELIPYNLGKRLMSNDTVEYKGGLIDDFGDLKNIFKGATRVKEIELYENKIADLYLDDSQKKAILKSRINIAKIDLIREEAAQEVDDKFPDISALQFNKKVEEIAKPKIDNLFNSVWGETKAILDNAEAKKKTPLMFDDPEDNQILAQIMKEAGNNKQKARQIAKQKGYTIGQ